MAKVPNFVGMQYSRDGTFYAQEDYRFFNEQYATSSYKETHNMKPALILKPKDDDDIISAIQWATEHKVAIAIKSGGHQYSGASSCGNENVQLDLSDTYKDMKIIDTPKIAVSEDRTLVFAAMGYFFQPGNAPIFGLLGDYITEIRMIDNEGKVKHIKKEDKETAELFYAILGGSPGNFGVITHYTTMAFQAKSYMGIENEIKTSDGTPKKFHGPHGMSDENTAPRGFDLCVNVLSMDFPITKLFPAFMNDKNWEKLQGIIERILPDKIRAILKGKLPPIIVLYAQWCPLGDQQKYDESVDAWFEQFRALNKLDLGCFEFDEFDADMATMMVVERLKLICDPFEKLDDDNKVPIKNDLYDNCKISAQIQCFGGENSMFYKNGDNGTSYSWRDSAVIQTIDCWYSVNEKGELMNQSNKLANDWQTKNDSVMIGESSCFSKTSRRVLWGSWGDWDMGNPEVWRTYYEDEAKYQRLGRARMTADPNGIFTANPFAVARQS
ncbi:hypothetical protein F53441_3657 [Fusarium austroafricanum]|uniref:FAD linked oxidase N-terminal domain-containing protein n=1 Tax=Fusarium austroafricanum TaxID=2364996 RepID=A0A8H4P1H7_9HYPO|nr:hypothetical protein F53441_3657 [Fusarium austroafricanum]